MQVKNKFQAIATHRWIAITLVAGFLLSIAASLGVSHFNRQYAEQAVVAAAEKAADAVVTRLHLYQYGLRGARGAIKTVTEDAISRDGFTRYSLTRDVDSEFPGARGFGFIRRVAPQDEAHFLAQARSDGWANFNIRQLAEHSGERYVIQYIEPVARNEAAVGLDIASESNRREAAQAAMRTGEVQLTAPITLVQATGNPQQSFLIVMPIYRSAVTPATVEQREVEIFGWSFAPLLMQEVLRGLQPKDQVSHFVLRDITEPGQRVQFYQTDDEQKLKNVFSHRVERDVFGRRWQIEYVAHPLFIAQLHQLSPQWVLVGGVLLSLLLAALVGVLSVSRLRQLQVMAEQAKLAAIVQSSVDGIIGKTPEGIITSWNKGAEKLFGYSSEEAVGHPLLELLIPPELWAEEADVLARVGRGEVVPSFNTQRLRKDGQLLAVSVTASPIRNSAGQVVGVSKTVRDISAQMAAEARIHELNSNLEAQVVERTHELQQLNLLLGSVLRSASEVAIIATDLDGTIRVFNTGAERMLGYTAGELVGRSTPACFHLGEEVVARGRELSTEYGQEIEGFRAFVHRAELEGAETREWTYVRKDGSRFPVTLAVTAMRDEQGALSGYLGISMDTSARKTAEKQRVAAREQLLMAAEVAELGIWSWDLADNTLQWNERMFELYGQPLSLRDTGLNYEHWYSRVHPEDVEAAAANLSNAVAGLGVYDAVFRVVRPDGQVSIVQAGAQVERNAKGTALRVTGINRDITVQREIESCLQNAKDQADAASAAKSSFLANMSHEIRTPMNAVLGMLRLVQNTELNGRQLDYVSKAETAAKSLLGLLNDILDYSKIEAGKLQLDIHAFELEPLMRDLAVVLGGNQGHKDVEVMFDLDPQLPCALFGDSLRLQQVLINLAGNALKFTQHGQVLIKLEQVQRLADTVQLRIEVSDTGIGIGPEQLERIFQGFTQAEASTTRRFGGTGLGLVISKRLVNLMGGSLQVASELGSGSRFWFDVTLGVVQPLPLRATCPGVDRSLRLLVADDNEVAGDLLMRAVQSLGWQADLVNNGQKAVERAQRAQADGTAYDVILMDWRMPDMDGLSAARLIREQNPERPAPMVIMVTAYGREVLADAQQDGDAPFAGFLTKPITLKQLADMVERVFTDAGPLPKDSSSTRVEHPKRLAGMQLLVVEDNMLNRQVAFELLQGEGARVTLAEGGLEGVRLATELPGTFDAVLMDIQMPDIDGLEATRRIRASAHCAALPIVAMTANASLADQQACLAAGMDGHVSKPIDLDVLVNSLLVHTGRESVLAVTTVKDLDALVEPTASIAQRFGGNLAVIRSVLISFAPEQEKQLARLQSFFVQGDAASAAALLHAIKGSAGTMGAQALSCLAGELEQQLRHGDEASRAQVLCEQGSIEKLRQLLLASDEQLQVIFALPAPSDASSSPVSSSDVPSAQWHEALQEVLQLLQAGNLQALERSEAIVGQVPANLRPQFDSFVVLVQSLDFAASLAAGHELLNSV